MRVQLAVPWTDDKRVEHRAGTKVQVTPEVGRLLIIDGHAAPLGEATEPEQNEAADKPSKPADTKPEQGTTRKGAGDGSHQ